jgi:uncharacterized protein (DUF983 family)
VTGTPPRQDVQPARIDPIRAGLLCRCPNCGRGPLYAGFLKVVDRCRACGFDFTRLNTGDGAAVFIIQIVGFPVVFGALAIEIAFAPPMWLHLMVWPTLAVVGSLALMRPGKGAMIALQMKNRAAEARNDD